MLILMRSDQKLGNMMQPQILAKDHQQVVKNGTNNKDEKQKQFCYFAKKEEENLLCQQKDILMIYQLVQDKSQLLNKK